MGTWERILGIDQGTTSTRACVMDAEGKVLARAKRAHAQHHPRPGWVEHDPDEIWRNTRDAALEALGRVAGPVSAIAIANQGETVCLWDRATGTPLAHAIV